MIADYSALMRRLRRVLKFLLKLIGVVLIVLFLFLLLERVRGQMGLARYKRELISSGEKLSANDFITRTNTGENGAPDVMAAIKQLKDGTILPSDYPPVMSLTHSGHAVIGFRENDWVGFRPNPAYHKATNDWNELAADLKTNKATLEKIRVALNKPVLSNNLDLSQGYKLKFLHLAPAKSLTFWFGSKAQLALREGNTREAADDLMVELRIQNLLANDNLLISELVRTAIFRIDRAAIWEALQADGWNDQELARMQEACQNLDFASAMAHALEGERVFDDACYDLSRKSNDDAFGILYWESAFGDADSSDMEMFFRKQVYCRVWRFAWSYQDQCHNLEKLQSLIEISRKAAKEKSYSNVFSDLEGFTTKYENRNWYNRLRYPNAEVLFPFVKAVRIAMQTETERSQLLCAIALKRYSLRNEKYPASLNDLVPEFLPSVPADYMEGKPMKYHLNGNGTFTLYSVGENGTDDGGDNTPVDDSKSKNLWNRKDMVWPAPATPNEIAAWRKEQIKDN